MTLTSPDTQGTIREFPLRVVLTITTGRLLTQPQGPHDNGISELYDILGHMTGDAPFSHQLGRFSQECAPWLLRWFPLLGEVNDGYLLALDMRLDAAKVLPESKRGPATVAAINDWLSLCVEAVGGDMLAIGQIPRDDHDFKDPLAELSEMVGDKAKVVVVKMD